MIALIKKIILIGFPIIFVLHILLGILFNFLLYKNGTDFFEIIVSTLVSGFIITTAFALGFWGFFKSKITFLASDSPIDNRFGNNKSIVNFDAKLDYNKFKQILSNDFILTYLDKNKQLIKIRDRFKLFSWGAAAVITVDNDNNSIKINSFPMNGTGNKLANELTNKVNNIIKNL